MAGEETGQKPSSKERIHVGWINPQLTDYRFKESADQPGSHSDLFPGFRSIPLSTDTYQQLLEQGREAPTVFPEEAQAIQTQISDYQTRIKSIYLRLITGKTVLELDEKERKTAEEDPEAWKSGKVTPSQQQALYYAATGMTNQEIGKAWGVSHKDIRNLLGRAYSKLRVSTRDEAVPVAVKQGIIDLSVFRQRGNPEGIIYLSRRLREIYSLYIFSEGSLSTREMADRLYISEQAFKNQMTELLLRLGLSRRVQLHLFEYQLNAEAEKERERLAPDKKNGEENGIILPDEHS